ncbi:LacI family DNA-binding transcriptional regulator [uncultured Psychroserpens sp.]|uniref:LacI family DNA-binding transcriptional regulator n=1 Tax=uncultured Psychroserpens sp. TaxID=255436 RepID=UPI00261C1037|nr:LacI family DNA-binding transcriptional regulator [uncultured Psychroserpens sp.]
MSTITLKELSLVSGYSVSTVSKALNNKSDISKNTREVIKTIANKYNYIPNTSAVALRKKKTKAISVIVPQVNTSFYSCFLFNIEKIAYSRGYRVILFQSLQDASREKEFINSSNDGSVDGIIIISCSTELNIAPEEKNILPVEYVKINDIISEAQLKKESIMHFSNLLRRITKFKS